MQSLSQNTGFIYPSATPNAPQGFVQPPASHVYGQAPMQAPMQVPMQGMAMQPTPPAPPVPPVLSAPPMPMSQPMPMPQPMPNPTITVNGIPYNAAEAQSYLQSSPNTASAGSSHDAQMANDLFTNGVLDWQKISAESERLYISLGHPSTRYPISPLPEAVHQRMLPSLIRTEIARYFDMFIPIISGAKNNAIHRRLADTILVQSLELASAAIKLEKTSTKLSAIHKLDEVHEELRFYWYVLYKSGFLGWAKQGRAYNRKRGITNYTRINTAIDIIGRLIGNKLNELSGRQRK